MRYEHSSHPFLQPWNLTVLGYTMLIETHVSILGYSEHNGQKRWFIPILFIHASSVLSFLPPPCRHHRPHHHHNPNHKELSPGPRAIPILPTQSVRPHPPRPPRILLLLRPIMPRLVEVRHIVVEPGLPRRKPTPCRRRLRRLLRVRPPLLRLVAPTSALVEARRRPFELRPPLGEPARGAPAPRRRRAGVRASWCCAGGGGGVVDVDVIAVVAGALFGRAEGCVGFTYFYETLACGGVGEIVVRVVRLA